MGKIVIFRNGSAHLDLVERGKVTITDGTFNRAMLSDDSVTLKVNSNSVLDIKVNDYFTLFGENYRINQLPTFTKNSNSSYEYQIVAQGLMYDLLRCKFFNTDGTGFKTTLDFPLIGDLELFLTVVANNMKRFSDKWEFKSYPFQKGETKTLTFGSDTCLSALQKICQEFKTDFWVKSENGKFVIHTGDFGNTIPVTFEYGKGNGLYALSRSNVKEEGVINRMYVEGSSENLPHNYRNFSDRLKFSDAGYLEDADLIAEMGLKEGELKLDDIYPSRTGKVTALGDTKFKFIDNTMDFDLNEKEADGITTKYLKPDTTAKIHFNTGNLAGYEFEIKKGGYKHSTKEFEIIPITTTSGQKIPDLTSGAFQFAVNDEYVLIDIYAPEIYITDAENKLLAKATEQFALKKQVEVSYDLIVDPEYIKNLQTKINVGDYVMVKDTELGVDKVIRVNSISQNFIKSGEWKENDYKITIADTYEISYASQLILDVREIQNVNNITNQGEINYSLIGMKNTRELQSMVFDTDGYFDPVNIKPNSIETNMLTVGSQSQQLSCSVVFRVNADGLKNKIVSENGKLFSQTFNKTWDIPALTFEVPDDVARYVYAKCSKTGTSGSIFYSQAQIKFDTDPNDYYFLVGVLHSVVEGMRVLSITIGTTTINGGLVRTGIISSLDGQTYFNLNTGEFKGKFTFANGTNVQAAVENAQNAVNGAVKSVDVEYYLSNSPTSLSGGNWVTIAPTWVNGKYMWSRTKTTLVNGNITYTPSANGVCIAGAEGTSGVGISSITERYLASDLASGVTASTSGWTTTIQTISPTKKYLWNYETITYTNGSTSQTEPVIIGTYGDKGIDGVGIESIVEYYLASASPSGVTINTAGWTSTVQTIDTTKKYLWNYTKTTYTNGTFENTNPVLIGTMGANGANGQGITSITENYYLSTSKTEQVGGSWTNTPPTWIPNTYLWTRSTIVWNNPTATTTTQPIVDSSWEAVNDIQIGGRNLARNSKLRMPDFSVDVSKVTKIADAIRFANTNYSANHWANIITQPLQIGEVYTFSVKYRTADQPLNGNDIRFFINGSNKFYLNTPDTAGEWRVAHHTFTLTLDNSVNFHMYFSAGVIDMEWFALVKGNKPMIDWTPAPEDIDAAVAGANANAATALAQAQNAQTTAAAAAAVTSFMQTTIDGNTVSTGTLQVGDVNGANAMISGVTDRLNGESIRFAAGKSYAEKYLSPFQVLDNGMVRFVNPATGQKTFELGYNQNTGKVVFDIYNENGVKVASIGSQGIMFTGYIPESYERQNMRKLTTTTFTQAEIASEMSMNIGRQLLSSSPSGNSYNVGIVTNIETYLYDPGRNFESAGNAQYAGYYPTKNKLGPTVSDGIYVRQALQQAEDYGDINTYVEYYVIANQITNGKITNTIGFTISVRIKDMSFVTFGDGDFY